MKKTMFRLETGASAFGASPILSARYSYLWIGNDAASDKRCYATLSGVATLRRLRDRLTAILRVHPRRRRRAR